MKRFLRRKKGFTIVELVIVIGVIGILSAILIPTFVNLNSKASEAARKSDLAAVYTEYVADVADGYYGEEKIEAKKADKTYGQNEVYLAIVADTATEKYYTYGTNPDSEGWDTRAKASPADSTHQLQQLGGDGNTYTSKGYAVYILVPVNPNPLF